MVNSFNDPILLHQHLPGFEAAVHQPGATSACLCYGAIHFPGADGAPALQQPSLGDMFFLVGELCVGGELWDYQLHREAFPEVVAKRMFGQLARALCHLKYAGMGGFPAGPDGKVNG